MCVHKAVFGLRHQLACARQRKHLTVSTTFTSIQDALTALLFSTLHLSLVYFLRLQFSALSMPDATLLSLVYFSQPHELDWSCASHQSHRDPDPGNGGLGASHPSFIGPRAEVAQF